MATREHVSINITSVEHAPESNGCKTLPRRLPFQINTGAYTPTSTIAFFGLGWGGRVFEERKKKIIEIGDKHVRGRTADSPRRAIALYTCSREEATVRSGSTGPAAA